MSSNHSSTNELTTHQSTANTTHNAERNLPEHPQANQPQTEAERQQQLQDAHLENQDARVSLGDQKPQGANPMDADSHQAEHKEIGSMNQQSN